ncbi:hypothetical protein [Angustibacter aerolatus]|uniref:Uncharacterized protein n=1 Tax=Angustibacter aerolatus TaxID=1162965 RepID=A0ABQ6JGL7_9ACTN|nr:hypothetical protein [Angustibacter aerolatus]GMA86345.1 hypothetical protein GCM10025868_15950 [Angustibacter aerolatus]
MRLLRVRPAAVVLVATLVDAVAWAVGGAALDWVSALLFGPVLRFGLLWLLLVRRQRIGWHLLWLFWVGDLLTVRPAFDTAVGLGVVAALSVVVQAVALASPTLRSAGRGRSAPARSSRRGG